MAEPSASDRVMSIIPPDEFYPSRLDPSLSVSEKHKRSLRNLGESRFLATKENPKSSDDFSKNTADCKKSLVSSDNPSNLSGQSQLPSSATSTEHLKEENERPTSGVSQESSGHRKKRTRSASHGAASRATTPPLGRSSKGKRRKRRERDILPLNVTSSSEDDRPTQPFRLEPNPGNAGQPSALGMPDRNSRCMVNNGLESPESSTTSRDLSVDTTPATASATPSSPEKRMSKTSSSYAKSSGHDMDAFSDSTSSSETSGQTPVSSLQSKKRRRNESSSLEKNRRKTSRVHLEPSRHDGTKDHIFVEEAQSSVTPEPGPPQQSKGKGRTLSQNAGESESSHSRGIRDRGQEMLQHLSPNIQRSRHQTRSPVPALHRSRFLGRDTPWLEDTVERKVKQILEKHHMPPPPPPPNSLRPRPQNYVLGDVLEGQGLTDEQIVAIAKDKRLSSVVRFARAPDVFGQSGSIRANYYYLKNRLNEEDWQRVGPKKKVRAPPRPNAT